MKLMELSLGMSDVSNPLSVRGLRKSDTKRVLFSVAFKLEAI